MQFSNARYSLMTQPNAATIVSANCAPTTSNHTKLTKPRIHGRSVSATDQHSLPIYEGPPVGCLAKITQMKFRERITMRRKYIPEAVTKKSVIISGNRCRDSLKMLVFIPIVIAREDPIDDFARNCVNLFTP